MTFFLWRCFPKIYYKFIKCCVFVFSHLNKASVIEGCLRCERNFKVAIGTGKIFVYWRAREIYFFIGEHWKYMLLCLVLGNVCYNFNLSKIYVLLFLLLFWKYMGPRSILRGGESAPHWNSTTSLCLSSH